jgi:AcrR family transcriptional regulator
MCRETPEGKSSRSVTVASDEKRDCILRAALEVSAQSGVAAARMEEIAARAEVSKGTLYRYFSKEDLLLATILASYVEGQRHVDAEREDARDPRDALALLCNGLADVLVQISAHSRIHYQAWGIVAGTPASEAKLLDFLRNVHRARDKEIEELVRAGQAAGVFRADVSPTVVADAVTALLSGFIYRRTSTRAPRREALRVCFVRSWLPRAAPALIPRARSQTAEATSGRLRPRCRRREPVHRA